MATSPIKTYSPFPLFPFQVRTSRTGVKPSSQAVVRWRGECDSYHWAPVVNPIPSNDPRPYGGPTLIMRRTWTIKWCCKGCPRLLHDLGWVDLNLGSSPWLSGCYCSFYLSRMVENTKFESNQLGFRRRCYTTLW